MQLNRIEKILLISAFIATTAIVYKMADKKKMNEKAVGPFIPTNEWQEVLPGQSVPKGLKIRMDFNTHKKYAKLDDGVDDSNNMGVVVVDQEPKTIQKEREMDEADKLAKIISDALLNKDEAASNETSDEMKERVLLSLPEPLEELKHYHHLSEEKKKEIIDQIWERRQKDLEEAMKNIRGDILYFNHTSLMIEHLETLRSLLPTLPQQLHNETVYQQLEAVIEDIQWLILDVDNVEDFLKMKGEETLFHLLTALQQEDGTPLLMNTVVTIATMYKNSISLTDFTTCKHVLEVLRRLFSQATSGPFKKKLLYSMNIMMSTKPEMGAFFLQQEGVQVLEQCVLGADLELKKKGLEMYKNLLQMFEDHPQVATSNVCSQALQDLTAGEQKENYPLLQAYFEYFKVAKASQELSCITELKKSGVFMTAMKERYQVIRSLAREEVQEEGEEGYYASLVYLIHSVLDKDVE